MLKSSLFQLLHYFWQVTVKFDMKISQLMFSQYDIHIFYEITDLYFNFLLFIPPTATPDPLANHEVPTGFWSALLCRGGSTRSGQRWHGGHRPQTGLCHVSQKRE